jgi:hypothetical protein
MTVTSAAVELTPEDVAALRMADGVSFHVHDGTAHIRASLDTNKRFSGEPRILTAREQRTFHETHEITGDRGRKIICDYRVSDHSRERPTDAVYACFHYEMFARDREWQTIARSMHAGDHVRLDWTAGNDSPVMNAAGYHRDELRLVLAEPQPEGKPRPKPRTFLVAVYVGPDNTARMVRRV